MEIICLHTTHDVFKRLKKLSFILLGFFIIESLHAQSHPYIIIKESEYDSLRNRSAEWPWSEMKIQAEKKAMSINYDPELNLWGKCNATFYLAGAAALAYILDTTNSMDYLKRAEIVVAKFINDIRTEKETTSTPTQHKFSVVTAHASFMVYIMMDIMYKDLNPAIRISMEQDCDFIASNHHSSWMTSKYSIEAMMELYHNGITDAFIDKKDLYKDYLLSLTSEDGSFTTGPGYTSSRLYKDERSQKKLFMDIAEYQGFNEFYSHPKLRDLHEWIFGYAYTPFNRTYTFGDSSPTISLNAWTAPALRLSRFSPKAQQYAAWHLGSYTDHDIIGNILHYILCDHIPLPYLKPQSRIFKNGGAWLLDSNYHKESLTAVLWNINTINSSHSHRDANSINICGFGDYIIRNSGYDGWGLPDESTWNWIHTMAASSNTITINQWNHSDFRGGGITEGITGYSLEYASGNSGSSITTGMHDRNLLFVKPEEGLPGYFVLFDEVTLWNPAYQIQMHIHPNSDTPPVIRDDGQVYDWIIKKCYTNNDVRVRICLGSNPVDSEIKDSYFASDYSCSRFIGKYMLNTYEPDNTGNLTITTLIYPFLGEQYTPFFNRIKGINCSGTEFRFNGELTDYTFKSETSSEGIYQGIRFIANAVYFRVVNDDVLNYFARKGTKVDYQSHNRFGFESESPVTIICTGKTGNIISDSTNVILYYPLINNIILDGIPAEVIEQGSGWKKIFVPKGNHHFQIESTFSVRIQNSEITSDRKILPEKQTEILCIRNYPNPFSVSSTINFPNPSGKPYRMYLIDLSGKVVRMQENISTDEFQLNRMGLGKGMYIIKLTGEKVYQSKLVIE